MKVRAVQGRGMALVSLNSLQNSAQLELQNWGNLRQCHMCKDGVWADGYPSGSKSSTCAPQLSENTHRFLGSGSNSGNVKRRAEFARNYKPKGYKGDQTHGRVSIEGPIKEAKRSMIGTERTEWPHKKSSQHGETS